MEFVCAVLVFAFVCLFYSSLWCSVETGKCAELIELVKYMIQFTNTEM